MIIMIIVRKFAPVSPTRVAVSDVGKDESSTAVLMDALNDAIDPRTDDSEDNNYNYNCYLWYNIVSVHLF